MKFSQFATHLQELEATGSRITMTQLLAKLYQKLDADEVAIASYLLQGVLLPAYESLEFQLSIKMVIRALARMRDAAEVDKSITTDLFGNESELSSSTEIMTLFSKLGDLGLVAEKIRAESNQPTGSLTVREVYDQLVAIAQENGAGSQDRKLQQLSQLFSQLDSISSKFVSRMVLGKMRLGFSTMTMMDALSWAMTGSKVESEMLEASYQRRADIGKLAEVYLVHDSAAERVKALENVTVEVGVPLVPALCQRLNSSQEIIDKMGQVFAESKYDGLRVQIHILKPKNQPAIIKTFTRNLEDTSQMFPELGRVVESIDCESCILDAEAIGYDPDTNELVTFQETVTRKRKHDIEKASAQTPIRFYVFDVLSLDGRSLLEVSLRERKDVLKKLFSDNEVLYHSPFIITGDADELRIFHEAQLAKGLEGAVIKQCDSVYQPGRKGWNWVKIKEEEGSRGKLNDTLDCVVMGYYAGRGKRTQFGLGAFLVGVLAADQSLKTIAKIGTGLSDEQFGILKAKCQPLVTPDQPKLYDVNKASIPSTWVKPGVVVEIAADELTRSPIHTAGVALRFPRLVTFRDDKSWEQATTVSELSQIK